MKRNGKISPSLPLLEDSNQHEHSIHKGLSHIKRSKEEERNHKNINTLFVINMASQKNTPRFLGESHQTRERLQMTAIRRLLGIKRFPLPSFFLCWNRLDFLPTELLTMSFFFFSRITLNDKDAGSRIRSLCFQDRSSCSMSSLHSFLLSHALPVSSFSFY